MEFTKEKPKHMRTAKNPRNKKCRRNPTWYVEDSRRRAKKEFIKQERRNFKNLTKGIEVKYRDQKYKCQHQSYKEEKEAKKKEKTERGKCPLSPPVNTESHKLNILLKKEKEKQKRNRKSLRKLNIFLQNRK